MMRISFYFLLCWIFFSSCSNDVESAFENPPPGVSHHGVEEAFENFECVLTSNVRAFQFMADNPGVLRMNPQTRAMEDKVEDEYTGNTYDLSVFVESAKELISVLGFTESDLYEMTNDKSIRSTKDLSDVEKINLAFLSYAIKEEIIYGSGSYFVNVGHEIDMRKVRQLISVTPPTIPRGEIHSNLTRGSVTPWMFVECFGEAFGFNVGVGTFGGMLIKGLDAKTLRQLTVKVVVRFGIKTLTGLGAAIMAAEVAYCMYEKSHRNQRMVADPTIKVPDWWTPNCGYTMEEAASFPVVLYNHSMECVYSLALVENKGKVPNVYRITKEDIDISFFY